MRRIRKCELKVRILAICILICGRDFVPDSGQLSHLRLPRTTETVRVDAGFRAGDEVSSYYDPMIAKLIVQGATREIAIRKLHAALEDYEIVGPITNIEFLKKICQNPGFIAGDVETGFISKRKQLLFEKHVIEPETYAQAALGMFFLEASSLTRKNWNNLGHQSGFGESFQKRSYRLIPNIVDGKKDSLETRVEIEQLRAGVFRVAVDGTTTYASIASHYDSNNRTIRSYFPHMRLETRMIAKEGNITLFQQGLQYSLQTVTPRWIEKALGIKDQAHSVLAPMPCKILRVDVSEGDNIKKDQVLVVIESMKMETVIRSPQDGTISRIVHRQGVRTIFLT